MGSKSFEASLEEEARDLIAALDKKTGQPFSTHGFFHIPVVNVVWQIISGEKFGPGDLKAKALIDGIMG
jgi:hypothetical protein